jgi:hypothetical protein
MREITTHHDGLGLNDLIRVEASDEDANGVPHHIAFYRTLTAEERERAPKTRIGLSGLADDTGPEKFYDAPHEICVGILQFQHGPRNGADSRPGLISDAVFAALIEIARGFANGPYACPENHAILQGLTYAAQASKDRAKERAARGVLGHNKA